MFELRAGKTDRRIWISDRYGVGSIGFVGFDLVMEVIVNKVLLGSFGLFWKPMRWTVRRAGYPSVPAVACEGGGVRNRARLSCGWERDYLGAGAVTVNAEERAIVQRLSNQNTEVKSFFTTIKVRERTTFIPSAKPPADQLALALPAHSPASIAAQD